MTKLSCRPRGVKGVANDTPETIFRDDIWVWEALIKQFEIETGLPVAAIDDLYGHILGKEFEDFKWQVNKFSIEFKGVEFEIDAG